ncbi:mucin-6-like [Schistocerca americana]|uniref:mucin-6-like n=1 Tax=Schistocerca americana TaxID=7009 RepID=UPI001F500E61|nr:mucin-6-like [Schistocerca americana]
MRRLTLPLPLPLLLALAAAGLGQLTGTAKAPTRTEASASGPGDNVQVTISQHAFGTQTSIGGAIHKTAMQSSEFQGRLYEEIANDVESGPDGHSMTTRAVGQVPGSSGTVVHTVKEIDLEGLDVPSNDVAVSAESSDTTSRNYYQHIQPTRTQESSGEAHAALSSTAEPQPGEAPGAPRGRSLPLLEPRQASAAGPATASGDQRKTNPDIQDIITGIVKLLNGNVKVQVGGAPTAPLVARPGRPTRINNRGPPRITDVPLPPPPPPPAMMPPPPPPSPPTRGQHPYPFHRPHLSHQGNGSMPMVSPPYVTGVPLPEQVVPVTSAITSWGMRPPPPDHTSVWPDMEPPKEQIYSTDFSDSYGDSELSHSPPVTVMTTASFSTSVKEITDIKAPSKNDSVDASGAETDPGNVLHDHKSGSSQKNEKETVQTETASSANNNSLAPSNTSLKHETDPTSAIADAEKPSLHTTSAVETVNETTATTVSTKATTPKTVVDKVSTSKAPPTKSTTMKPTTPKQSTPKTTLPKTTSTEKITVPRRTSVTLPETTTAISPTEALGVGVAEPVLESSMHEWPIHQIHTAKLPDSATNFHTASQSTGTDLTYNVYRPRPGIVLDDTEYKPTKPTIAAGEIFDVTVTAIQGPGGSVNSDGRPHRHPETGDVSVITMPQEGQHFVSIDGKRTYINLFGSTTDSHSVAPSRVHQFPGFAVPEDQPTTPSHQVPSRRPFTRRPTQTPVRIDTCIVGDDSTCDAAQNEICRTEQGVSSCHCRPGFSRRKHREPCRRIVSMVLSLRVDRMYDKRITWNDDLRDKNSDEYQQLQWEASQAINSAMSMTPFSDDVMGVNVNGLYTVGGYGPVFANVTLQLEETAETLRPAVRHDIRRHLLGAIQRRGNNVGASALWVDSLPGAVTDVLDLDECSHPALHDCHSLAACSNVFGTFRCVCPNGLRDPWAGDMHHSGRKCEACPQQHCSGHGECRFEGNQQVCHCTGNFYGSQCEIDGEVLGVAVGASLAALVIIVLTLVFLCMWSRRWSKEQKTVTGVGSPVFDYMGAAGSAVKTPSVGAPPYQVTLEDRLRWAQLAGAMAQANHYTLDTMNAPTRPSSVVFGYPNRAPSIQQCQTSAASRAMSLKGTHTADSSSSEEEDQVDLLGRNFHVPRPKSRSSIANQSGIYYDVEYEPEDIYSTKHPPTSIPLSTYRMGHLPYYQK